MRYHPQKHAGFTIVELLVVIVVIGILAAITILAFNGIGRQASTSALQSELRSTANKLKLYAVDNNDRFPASLVAAGIADSNLVAYQYTYTSLTNSFCVTAYHTDVDLPAYFVNELSGGVPAEGECPGHTDPGDVLSVSWTARTSLGTGNWRAVAISGDGQRVVVVPSSGFMRLSVDGGVTWAQQTGAGSRSWTDVAISDNGQVIIGVAESTSPVLTTNGGSSWSSLTAAGSRSWQTVTISADGTQIAAGATATFGNYVHTSSDTGVTWTQRTSIGQAGWQSIDSSANGQHIIALPGGGGLIRYSSDFGANWSSAPYATQGWWGAAISDDGQRIVAAPTTTAGQLRQSLNGGTTWRILTGTPSSEWRGVDSSRDGEVIFAVNRNNGQVIYSTDAGDTWTYDPIIRASIRWVACSADCRELVLADATSGSVYTGVLAPQN